MKNVLWACLMIVVTLPMSSCKDPCNDSWWYFFPVGEYLKKQSFKPGTYWIYQDSATGIIDSQSVYYYNAENHVSVGSAYSGNNFSGGYLCTEYGDIFSMKIASYWNGLPHDTISSSNDGPQINFAGYGIRMTGERFVGSTFQMDTMTNFHVSGFVFPKVYVASGSNYQAYSADHIGVVRWVLDDTINGQHTWNLQRWQVINP